MKRSLRPEVGRILMLCDIFTLGCVPQRGRSDENVGVDSGWGTRNGGRWVRFWCCAAMIFVCGIFVVPHLCAAQEQNSAGQSGNSAAAQLQLVPQPREVKVSGGEAFAVTRHTRILVDRSFGEDFQGAAMLAEEIERWTGWKLKISDEREMPGGTDFIFIGDATKDAKLREALGTSGLGMQNGFDSQGYVISADHRRILVGGASAQGAFYGVQTLRQLMRPANSNDGKEIADSSESRKNAAGPSGMPTEVPPFANSAKDGAPEKASSNAGSSFDARRIILGVANQKNSTNETASATASLVPVLDQVDEEPSADETDAAVPPFARNAKDGAPEKASSNADSSFDARRIVLGTADSAASFVRVSTQDIDAGSTDKRSAEADSSPTSAAEGAAAGFGMTDKSRGEILRSAQYASLRMTNENSDGETAKSFPSSIAGANSNADSSSPLAGKRWGFLGMTKEGGEAEGDEDVSDKNGSEIRLECPAVGIRDWPAMKWRGVSIDISRGPIPKLEFMEKQIRTLAGYKVNMYALYMEDVFTVKGNQIFAPPDALTPEEIKQLVAYAQKYYVTIVPELETFGHLHNILRYDLYSDLAEIPHGSVLTPTEPGTYDLLGKLIAEMEPLFPGPFFHIGADETLELGQGKTKQLIAQQGLGPVYLAHIAKLDAMLKPYGKQTMFWADIAEKFPQLLPTLPKDLIAVIWTYDNAPSYDNRLKPFKDAGLKTFVSPGITDWRRVYPDFNYSFLNIRNLTRDGQKYGAMGMLNTDWKDMGEALEGMAWPGLVYGAACGWQAGESDIGQFRDSYDWAFYRNTDHTFEGILDKLAATNTLLDGVKLEGTHVRYFWASPFSQDGAQVAEAAAPVVHEMRVDAEQAWEALLDNRGKARLHADSLDDLIFAAQRLDFFGMKLEYTQEMSAAYWDAYMDMGNSGNVYRNLETISSINGDLQDLREKLTQLRSEYAERWRAENNEAWLGNVLSRYDAITNTIQEKINAIDALEGDFSGVKVLPPPENLGFYYRPGPQPPPHP